jgi:uncharacterized SAM-binding protein YcdF (DUF218 family)
VNSQPSTIDYQPPPIRSPVVRQWLRRLLWFAAFCFLLSAFCFAFRSPLLTGLANAWIVNDPLTNADAIVVLGGGVEYRPAAAAQLYARGLAHTVLVAQPEWPPSAKMGLTVPEGVTARLLLISNGVPPAAITPLGTNVTNTREEALALKSWLAENKARSVIIPTDLFHTRRARWIFLRTLRGNGVRVEMEAVTPSRYAATNWWQREQGLIDFQNEIVKSLYYRLKY